MREVSVRRPGTFEDAMIESLRWAKSGTVQRGVRDMSYQRDVKELGNTTDIYSDMPHPCNTEFRSYLFVSTKAAASVGGPVRE